MRNRPTLEQACGQYPYRFTMEHVPEWASNPAPSGCYPAPQYATDREWYEHTLFPGEKGNEHSRKYCLTSGQTWPLGRTLPRPYRRSA